MSNKPEFPRSFAYWNEAIAIADERHENDLRAENERLRVEVATLENLAVRNAAEIEWLRGLLRDVEGSLLAYWTDLPEAEVQRLIEVSRSVDTV